MKRRSSLEENQNVHKRKEDSFLLSLAPHPPLFLQGVAARCAKIVSNQLVMVTKQREYLYLTKSVSD